MLKIRIATEPSMLAAGFEHRGHGLTIVPISPRDQQQGGAR